MASNVFRAKSAFSARLSEKASTDQGEPGKGWLKKGMQ